MKLSIIIPAHNEEKRIPNTLEAYGSFYSKKFGNDVEIIVVPNGCSDNTSQVINNYSKKYKIIKCHEIKSKIGKGGAIIQGFRMAIGSLIGYVDADMATSPDAFYDLIAKINGHDGVIASRWMKGAKINKKQSLSRIIASRGFNLLSRIILGLNYHDTQCGAKVFKKEAIDAIKDDITVMKYSFDIDLLYVLKRKGFKVIETPTVWHDQEDSKLVISKTIPNMFLSIVRIRLYYSWFRFMIDSYDRMKKRHKT